MSRERHVDVVVRKHEALFIVHQGGSLIEETLNNKWTGWFGQLLSVILSFWPWHWWHHEHVNRGGMWQRCIGPRIYSVLCLTKSEPVAASECPAYQQATKISVECVIWCHRPRRPISYFLGAFFKRDCLYLEKNKLYPYQDWHLWLWPISYSNCLWYVWFTGTMCCVTTSHTKRFVFSHFCREGRKMGT